jgi:hypothetical protein
MAQVVEHLPSKCEALNLNPTIANKKEIDKPILNFICKFKRLRKDKIILKKNKVGLLLPNFKLTTVLQ